MWKCNESVQICARNVKGSCKHWEAKRYSLWNIQLGHFFMSAKHRKLKHFMHLFRSWQRSDTLIDMTKMWGHFYLKEEIYICTKLTLFAGFYLKIAGNCKKRKLTALPFGAPELTLVLFFLCNIFLFLYATVCAPSFVLIIFRLYIRYYCLFFLKK